MALLNRQFDAVIREYDELRLDDKHALDLRKEEVYSRIPELTEIDRKLAADSVSWAIASLSGNGKSIETLKASNQALSDKKAALLKDAGFPADYLEMKYTCPDCRDTGFIGSEKCHCFKEKLIKRLYSASNLKNAIAEENFDTFKFDYYSPDKEKGQNGVSPLENIKKAVDTAKDFVDNFNGEFKSLLIYGNTGTGKTFLCNCIAKGIMDKGFSVVYQTEYEFFDVLSKHKFAKDEDDYVVDEKYACIEDCDLLVIDDLGAELTNSFTASELFRIINERILNHRSTIISTNLTLKQIQENYSERVFSRIMDKYTLVKLYGDDIRLIK